MAVVQELYGTAADGRDVHKFTLRNKNGLELQVISLGATVISLKCPDRFVNNSIQTSCTSNDRTTRSGFLKRHSRRLIGGLAAQICRNFKILKTIHSASEQPGESGKTWEG